MKSRLGGATRWIVLFGALVCLAGGCATADGTANLSAAPAPQVPVLVTAVEVPCYSSPNLGLVEVTFENHTPVWKQVDRVTLDFGSPAKDQSVTIPSGDEIDAWARAITLRNAAQVTGADTGIEALTAAGSLDALGASIGHPVSAAAAATSAAGADPAPPSYTDQHLLTTPFQIPPGLSTKRWILLSAPDNPSRGCIDTMDLTFETGDHVTTRAVLRFKARASAWQPQACPEPPNLIRHGF